MDVDITSDIKKYTGRFCIALCILASGIAYIMMQTDTNNHTTLIAEGRLMYRTENILSPSGGTVLLEIRQAVSAVPKTIMNSSKQRHEWSG